MISVDLPLPLTPVTAIIFPSGKVTSTPLRLLPLQPRSVMLLGDKARGDEARGNVAESSPRRYFAVSVSAFSSSAGVPSNTICPPNRPALGPISII